MVGRRVAEPRLSAMSSVLTGALTAVELGADASNLSDSLMLISTAQKEESGCHWRNGLDLKVGPGSIHSGELGRRGSVPSYQYIPVTCDSGRRGMRAPVELHKTLRSKRSHSEKVLTDSIHCRSLEPTALLSP